LRMLDTFLREVPSITLQPSLASIVIDREHQRRQCRKDNDDDR
jgi:hypothetical protein